MRYILVILISASFFLTACEKQQEKVYFHDKYHGSWKFTTEYRSFSLADDSSSTSTDVYTGKIWYEEQDPDSSIRIKYGEKSVYTVFVDKEGNMSPVGYDGPSGQFYGPSQDSLWLYYRVGGRGGGTHINVSGYKID